MKDLLLFLKCRAHLIVIKGGGWWAPPPSLEFLPSKFQNGNFIIVVMNLVVSRSTNFRENERSIVVFEVKSAPHSQPNFEDFCWFKLENQKEIVISQVPLKTQNTPQSEQILKNSAESIRNRFPWKCSIYCCFWKRRAHQIEFQSFNISVDYKLED